MENVDKNVNKANPEFDIESNEVITNIDIVKNNIDKSNTNKNKIDVEENEKSSKNKKEKKPKKPKTIKQIIISRIILVIIFLAVVAGITYYFINLENTQENLVDNKENVISENKNPTQSSNYASVDLNGSYYTNPIKITKVTEDMDRVQDGFKYYEIDGLKNETIEEKINTHIKEDFKNYLKNLMDKTDEDVTYSIYISVEGNFANIISLEMYVTEVIDADEYEFNDYYHFCNLNLIDGEEITLGEDVLESKTVASNFLLETLYEPMAELYTEMDEDEYYLYPSEDSKKIEEEIYEIVSNYQRGKNFEFGITPSALLCAIETEDYTSVQYLFFKNYAKKLIIYDRFSSNKELYDGKYEKIRTFL